MLEQTEIKNTIALLLRTNISGAEAATVGLLIQKLQGMLVPEIKPELPIKPEDNGTETAK